MIFAYQVTGNVDDVAEVNGSAEAIASFGLSSPNGYLGTSDTYGYKRENGQMVAHKPVPDSTPAPNPQWEAFALPWGVTYDSMTGTSYMNPQLTVSLGTYATAVFNTMSGVGSAHAVSAAATIGVVENSMIVP